MYSCGMSVAPVTDWRYYGKLLSLAAIANRNNVFSCGMSVAPVTDWRYYGKLLSLAAIANRNNVFSCGMSVAPIVPVTAANDSNW